MKRGGKDRYDDFEGWLHGVACSLCFACWPLNTILDLQAPSLPESSIECESKTLGLQKELEDDRSVACRALPSARTLSTTTTISYLQLASWSVEGIFCIRDWQSV